LTFAHPGFLLLLLAVPLLAAWEVWRARRRDAAVRFPDAGAAAAVPPTLWVRLRYLPVGLRLGALALGVLALARPQVQDVSVERTTEGIDILLVLDLSTSMRAQDFRPNRFEAARAVAEQFIDGRTSDRIGLVAFAGRAYTHTPLTLDYPFLKARLRQLQMGMMEDGTAIGTALATAAARLRESEARSKVAILLTDGQNNRGEIDPLTAADLAAAVGVRVYAVGIGAEGLDAFGRPVPEHLRGLLPVDPGVDHASLTAVARRTGGAYYHASDREALEAIYTEISALETSTIQETTHLDVAERFGLFLWPALGLVLLEIALSTTRLRSIP
jgi:Ca-activated chloride channel homolog